MISRNLSMSMYPYSHNVPNWKTKPRLEHTCRTMASCPYWHVWRQTLLIVNFLWQDSF